MRGGPSRRQLVVLLGALSAFGPLATDTYLPALPAVGRDLSASASGTQLTLTACMIGLAIGQLLAGPVSDSVGRRRPLLWGNGAFVGLSALCAATTNIWILVALRLLQGAAGAAGIVIARAVVRDMYAGASAARFFALLALIFGVAPIVAPVVGGELLRVTSWRGIFLALAGVGAVLLTASWWLLDETLASELRHRGGVATTRRVFHGLLRDRTFMAYTVSSALYIAALFAYLSGSPYVLQDVYGASPQAFSLLFAMNALGEVAASQAGGRLADRVGPRRLLASGLIIGSAAGCALLIVVLLHGGLVGAMACMLCIVAAVGLVAPNASALALTDHPGSAGTASAVIGFGQFALGGAVMPLAGIGGTHTAVPMAVLIAALSTAAVLVLRWLKRPAAAEAM